MSKPDSICQAPGCSLPKWEGHHFCPHCILKHEQLAEVAAGDEYDYQLVPARIAAEMVGTRGFYYVHQPFELDGQMYACIALND